MENLPPQGEACLFVSNHQGNFDIPILIGFLNRPLGFISKIEVKKMPIVNKWMEHMNCVFMDRKDRRQAVQSINKGADNLKNGSSLVIFPEGTRSKGMKMNSFKAGSFKLAQKSGATIVPVAINGSYKIMEQNGFKIKPATVKVTILPSISKETYQEKDMKQIAAEVEEMITRELNQVK
ncbi:MAG: 1-acyl-sn-glycerol-3-phosphate acyltransferase [Bacillaceae bacterium]|nr:1-acyl-sn-glycerol-3-phosphate acyltransferase [Bacillaceae bacterium]